MKSFLLLFGAGLMVSMACAGDTSSEPANLQELMKDVAAQTQIIWDIGGGAIDDEGNPDASKLKDADWDNMLSAGSKAKEAAKTLAEAKHLVGAAPGHKIAGEENPGAFNAKDVERAIAANPQAFSGFALAFQASMDDIVTAARKRDVVKLYEVSGNLDQICEQCHLQFWYPQQNAAR